MANCNQLFNYTAHQEERLRLTRFSIPALNGYGIIVNLFTAVFIMYHPALRRRNFGTLNLLLFNLGECLLVRYTLTKYGLQWLKSVEIVLSSTIVSLITFFIVGQCMAIAVVTFERIQLVSGSLNSVNSIVRNPRTVKRRYKLLILMLFFIAVDALLSWFTYYIKYSVAPFVFINLVLYVILVTKVARLRTRIHGMLIGLRKKALHYVTALGIGFICECTVFFVRNHQIKEHAKDIVIRQTAPGCLPVMTVRRLVFLHLYHLRFIWEGMSYFLFNAPPRRLLSRLLKRLRRFYRRVQCYWNIEPTNMNSPAVIPLPPNGQAA